MKKIFCICILTLSNISYAVFDECLGVYVGRIGVDAQGGLNRVVFMEKSTNASGSYWVYFTGWDSQAKQGALSILLAAKLSNHRVDVYTTADDKCGIGGAGQVISGIDLSTNP